MRVNISQEETGRLLDATPDLTPEQDEQLAGLFPDYLFYQTCEAYGERWCACTACNQEFYTGKDYDLQFWKAKHNKEAACPHCGTRVVLKEIVRSKTRRKLYEEHRVLLLLSRPEGLYLRAAYASKDYTAELLPCVELRETARYYLAPGKAAMWRYTTDWTGLGLSPGGRQLVEGWKLTRTISEPFPTPPYYANAMEGYAILGVEELAKSPLRYHGYEAWKESPLEDGMWCSDLVRYLGEYAGRPQLELLAKLGLWQPIEELVFYRRSGGGLLDWRSATPWGLYRMDKQTFRAFRAVGGELGTLQLRRALKMRGISVGPVRAAELRGLVGGEEQIAALYDRAKALGLTPEEILGYLQKRHGGRSCALAFRDWADYLDSAAELGYDLKRRDVVLPKDLHTAHDRASAAAALKRDQVFCAQCAQRTQELRARYAFSWEGLLIRVPETMEEIVREGKVLEHCVGGYAERHMKGTLTILFLRREQEPDVPLATIEMTGAGELQQIRGFQNDIGAVPAREVYAGFLEPWLRWVAEGSRRDRQGRPVVMERKRRTVA